MAGKIESDAYTAPGKTKIHLINIWSEHKTYCGGNY